MLVSPNGSNLALGDVFYYARFLIWLFLSCTFAFMLTFMVLDDTAKSWLQRIRPNFPSDEVRLFENARILSLIESFTNRSMKYIFLRAGWFALVFSAVYSAVDKRELWPILACFSISLTSVGTKMHARISKEEHLKGHAVLCYFISCLSDLMILLLITGPGVLFIATKGSGIGKYEANFALKGTAKSLVSRLCTEYHDSSCGLYAMKDEDWILLENVKVEFSSSKSLFVSFQLKSSMTNKSSTYRLELDQTDVSKIERIQ